MNYQYLPSIRTLVEISRDTPHRLHMSNVVKNGKTHVGKLKAVLRDSHFDAINGILYLFELMRFY